MFLDGTVEAVNHLGEPLPEGTHPLTTFPKGVDTLNVINGGITVSQINNKGRRFLVLVNRSWEKPADLNLHFSAKAKLIRRDGTETSANLYETLTRIAPGDASIYEILSNK